MVLELQNNVWAQPVVVAQSRQVSIALLPNDKGQVDYEIYSQDEDQETVHCQGRAVWSRQAAPASLDLARLKAEMGQGELESSGVYAACARMGLLYGPSFQAIAAIHRGRGQVLAHLRLPQAAEEMSADYILHPSLMDGALQACIGLMEGLAGGSQPPRLPFALESLRIISRCTREMFAWVRYAPGSQAEDKVIKLDIDLCDERGSICVQMRGFSSRVLSQQIVATAPQSKATGSLLAAPVWQESGAVASGDAGIEYAEHHVILCELEKVNAGKLESSLSRCQCLALQAAEGMNIAQRYSSHALACFERIRIFFTASPRAKSSSTSWLPIVRSRHGWPVCQDC
jgi:polyketide synthase PksN